MRAQLLRGVGGGVVVKIGRIFVALGTTVLLARTLGAQSYGLYAYVLALITITAIPAQIGLRLLVLRETARTQSNKQWGLLRGLWRWGNTVVILLSLLIIIVVAIPAFFAAGRFSSEQLVTFSLGLIAMPLIALGNLHSAALRGLGNVVQGQLQEDILRSGLLILIVLAVLLLIPNVSLTAVHAMGLYVFAVSIAFVIGVWMLWRVRPVQVLTPKPIYQTKFWLVSTIPMAITTGLQLFNRQTDVIMLGFFNSTEDVGIYRVAVQGGILVTFGLQAINIAIGPHFVRLYAEGDQKGLERLVTLSARAILLTTFPVVVVILVYGKEILTLFFGAEFVPAYNPLAILCLGQLLNSAIGSVGVLLDMTGHEKDTAIGVLIAAVANVVLNLMLIPAYGMNGAAVATAATIVVWNALLYVKVRQRLDIQSTAIRI